MNRIHTSTLAIASLGFLAVGTAVAKPLPRTEHTRIVAELMATEIQWNQDIKVRDPAKFASHYTADGVLIAPFQAPMYRREGIEAGMKQAFSDANFTLALTTDVVGVSDDGSMAYTQGHCAEAETDPTSHAVVTNQCTYVTVYQRGASGGWLAVEDISSPAPPPKS